MNYWAERNDRAQTILTNKNIKATEKQIKKYYVRAMTKIIGQFTETYDKVQASIAEGKEPTPADLYKLDSYWQMQNQLRYELEKLGDEQVVALSKAFQKQWHDIYNSVALPGEAAFSTIDNALVEQMINEIWCADGRSWSQRIWINNNKLQEALNENLIHVLVAGKKTTELKKLLQEQFNVSYGRANSLVRTEIAHIQTKAAAKRYQDYGLEKYEILGREKDNCGNHGADCHEMDGKVFYYNEMSIGKNAPPFHPNCRCAIIPVID